MIIAPKKNFDWKLDERVKEWINLLSKDEKIKFMNSLNDELLENLYVWIDNQVNKNASI